MKFYNLQNLSLNLLLIFSFLLNDFTKKLRSEELNTIPTVDYIRRLPNYNFYILGPGDEILIKVSQDLPELEETRIIDGEGTIYLSRLKRIYVSGLTIEELTKILNKEYSKYVFDTDISIEVKSLNQLVFLDGEVENPGYYTLPGSNSPISMPENFSDNEIQKTSNNADNNVFFPSVVDALRASGGVTTCRFRKYRNNANK